MTATVLLLLLFLGPTSTNPQAEIDHSILEGDRIPPLKSHGQALEEELCFPGVLSDAPANLLRQFYGCLMPCTCCLDYYYYYKRWRLKWHYHAQTLQGRYLSVNSPELIFDLVNAKPGTNHNTNPTNPTTKYRVN